MDPFTCSSQGKTLFWALLFIWCVCVYSCTSVSCAEYKSEQKTSRLSVCLHVCAEVRRGQGGGCCDDRNKNIFTVRDLEATHLHIHALRITTTKNALPQPHQKATTMPSFLLTHIILDHLTLLIILPKCSKTYIFK